ncbi:DHA2 family efflux MFS transporter permease subunit [Pseudonocardia eucalypti]|uniref:DHA2 family efflux MFS transporter permease subunit n=1 Tax=Pseudonocardia eucalypti TaxID=648755 RepID=A0ABP9Q9U4_9PSEU
MLIVGMFMSLLDMTIVNVAVPSIQKDFGANTDEIQWVTTAYSLALGVIVPVSGWLGDKIGLTRTYILSMLGFAVGSALCGLAWDLESLVAFRIVQAVPGGVLPVVTLAMVYRMVPQGQIGSAMGMYGLGVVFAPALGPTLGGYLVEHTDWRLIFFINVPIGLVGMVLAVLALPKFPGGQAARFDLWGFATVASGLFALLLAFSKGEDWGWDSYPIMMLLVFGALTLALFVVIELEVTHPLIDVRIFRRWAFTNSVLLTGALSVGLYSVLFYVPLYVQESMGITPLRTGLMMMPEAIVMGCLMPVAGELYDRFGARWPAVIGLLIAAWGTYLLTGMNPDVPLSDVVLWTCIRAIGNGLCMMAIMTAGLDALRRSEINEGSALSNVAQRVSAALGLAVMTSLATSQQAQSMADRGALLETGDTAGRPELAHSLAEGPLGLYPLLLRTQADVTATAYGKVFFVSAVITALCALLALGFRRTERPAPEPAAPPRDAGDAAVRRDVGTPVEREAGEAPGRREPAGVGFPGG